MAAWATSAVFFLDNATLWTVTPAESRQWNQECIVMNFYDKHDVWHLLSAPALCKMAAFSLRCVIVGLFLVHCYADGHQSGNFSQVMQFVLDSSNNTRIHFHPGHVKNLFKIIAWSTDATPKDPVHVVVEQETNILSWTVPLILPNSVNNTDNVYGNTSRIFCDNGVDHLGWAKNFTVTLSTASPTNVTLYLLVKKDYHFNITSRKEYTVSVSPSQPDYFFYRFSSNETLTTVIKVNSNSELCLSASIQNNQFSTWKCREVSTKRSPVKED
ncbi:hypothetical protein GEV33_001223 [Tenebrio molitor]|uniref:Uncharacterized protein n=1 Tax=Tenebrio molitor TaxID=7067 RepID=A0A8J6HY22_TENMO|nr:hypothetical protein GEV33_001223 [Tenebrio molitor]